MTATTHAPKVVCQLRRAQRFAGILRSAYPNGEALEVAGILPADGWVRVARYAGIAPPSEDTVALTVELLRWCAEEDG